MGRDAVVVGINTYANAGMNLTAPAQDAEAIAKLLETHGDFKVRRLPGVKDKENNAIRVGQKTKVTLKELRQAIAQLFKPEGRNIPDTALLYFSGHGLRDNLGIQQGFLATSDVNPDLGNWGLSLQWLRQLLQESEVKQQIIILDCCYSGELLNFEEANPGNSGKVRDRCFIAASREFEVAYEGVGTNHSVLTQALLQGLDPTQTNFGDWVTNYSAIESIRQHLPQFPQRPIFGNSGEWINLLKTQAAVQTNSSARLPSDKTVQTNSSARLPSDKTVQTNSSARLPSDKTVQMNSIARLPGDICPYRGLLAFDCKEEDARYFFGREALTDQLLDKVRVSNFLAVLGASGSGKSSVVRAGLLYQLTLGQRLSGSENWEIKIIRPGERPLESLALAFVESDLSPNPSPRRGGEQDSYSPFPDREGGRGVRSRIDQASQLAKAEELLAQGSQGLRRLVQVSQVPRVVLVVDQFEEVFTLCQDEEERKRFFDCLLAATDFVAEVADRLSVIPTNNPSVSSVSRRQSVATSIILTMRADFFGKCAEYGELAQRIQTNLVTVTPMTLEELRQAIAEPAKRVNLELEPELVQQMLKDVENAPGSLPLLQYTLMELWNQRTDNCLRLNNYSQLGGVMGTLQKRATEVYDSFDETQQAAVQHIFLALTQLGEGTEDTRRRVRKEDLVNSNYSQQLIDDVVKRLADERLVVISNEGNHSSVVIAPEGSEAQQSHNPAIASPRWRSVPNDAVIDVAHEALIRHWTLLRKWVDGNREKLRQQRKIEAAAEEWRDRGKGKDYLWQGKPLQEAVAFKKVQEGSLTLSSLAGEFIQQSVQQRKNNRIKFIGLGLLFPAILAIFLGLAAEKQMRISGLWRTVDAAKGKKENLSRNQALQELVKLNVSLENIQLSGANLSGANLYRADFSGASLSGADLSGASLSGADLSGASLSGANFSGTNLFDTNLFGAYLSRADLNAAYLSGAKLKKAIYTKETQFPKNFDPVKQQMLLIAPGVNLSGADLSYLDLRGFDFKDINLSGADLNDTILYEAKNLTPEQVKYAKNWEKAYYDDEFSKKLGLPLQYK